MSNLKVLPAIDLLDGSCVRLKQGSFEDVKHYPVDPLAVAHSYRAAGARYLHVVDLDGAKAKAPVQAELIGRLARETGLKVQVGGGIRSLAQVQSYLDAGADRVVIGSLAILDPQSTASILEVVGGSRVTLAFDLARDEQDRLWPAVHAWAQVEKLSLSALFEGYRSWPELEYLCTDISRDGAMQGIDPMFYKRLMACSQGASLLVSGGVASLQDIRIAKDLGLQGVVIGKALYEGAFTLLEALSC